MGTYGLIGKSLSHSFSKKYFENKFSKENILDASYSLFEIPLINDFEQVLNSNQSLRGLNVTIPYKEEIIQYLDEVDDTAKEVGAVNTIKLKEGKLNGYNTDVYGFEQSLKSLLKSHHNKALVLGTGGAAKAVVYVLNKLNIAYQFVSTKSEEHFLKYEDLNSAILKSHPLIVNTTPLGMSPNIDKTPLSNLDGIDKSHLVYDLIYNPEETILLREAKQRGATTKNGLEMLELQAEKSWEIWNN